jgi:hypothetical protein
VLVALDRHAAKRRLAMTGLSGTVLVALDRRAAQGRLAMTGLSGTVLVAGDCRAASRLAMTRCLMMGR